MDTVIRNFKGYCLTITTPPFFLVLSVVVSSSCDGTISGLMRRRVYADYNQYIEK